MLAIIGRSVSFMTFRASEERRIFRLKKPAIIQPAIRIIIALQPLIIRLFSNGIIVLMSSMLI